MSSNNTKRPLAMVTGASVGIGYELAICCAKEGFDLLVVADQPKISDFVARAGQVLQGDEETHLF